MCLQTLNDTNPTPNQTFTPLFSIDAKMRRATWEIHTSLFKTCSHVTSHWLLADMSRRQLELRSNTAANSTLSEKTSFIHKCVLITECSGKRAAEKYNTTNRPLSQLNTLFRAHWCPIFCLCFLQASQQNSLRLLMIGSALYWRPCFSVSRKWNM